MTRHILDPEALYRVAVQQLKQDRPNGSLIVQGTAGQSLTAFPWGYHDAQGFHEYTDIGGMTFARPSATQPPTGAR